MKSINITEMLRSLLDPKKSVIKARIFVSREDGITIYDSIQNQTTASVSALVSGVWQASEALLSLTNPNQNMMQFRLGFDTSSQGVYLFPFYIAGRKYFFGAIYQDCLNPGQLKRQLVMIKEEMDLLFFDEQIMTPTNKKSNERDGFLFQEISDDEIDHLFSAGRI